MQAARQRKWRQVRSQDLDNYNTSHMFKKLENKMWFKIFKYVTVFFNFLIAPHATAICNNILMSMHSFFYSKHGTVKIIFIKLQVHLLLFTSIHKNLQIIRTTQLNNTTSLQSHNYKLTNSRATCEQLHTCCGFHMKCQHSRVLSKD